MAIVTNKKTRAYSLNADLTNTRRTLNDLDREQALQQEKHEAEYQDWIRGKATQFRGVVETFLAVFPLIKGLENDWRKDVFCGKQVVDPEEESAIYGLYATWHAISLLGPKLAEKAEYYRRHGCDLDFESYQDELARIAKEAESILVGWESPARSSAPSFRTPPLSEESSARLRELLS